MSIDINRKNLIKKINEKIYNGVFDEIDICALLIMIRDLSTENFDYQKTEWESGYLHEICDFIAHRSRNRGFIVEESNLVYKHSTITGVFHTSAISKRKIVTGLLEDKIISELNSVFCLLGLESIPHDNESDILLCLIGLLQQAEYSFSQGVSGFLYSIIDKDSILLLSHTKDAGLDPIILSTDNHYVNIPCSEINLIDSCFGIERRGEKLSIMLEASKGEN